MIKMIDLLEQSLIQKLIQAFCSDTEQLDDDLTQAILDTSDTELKHAFKDFFAQNDMAETMHALDIQQDHLLALQSGDVLKDQAYLTDTAKIVALCVALETNSLMDVEVSDCLQDYPI